MVLSLIFIIVGLVSSDRRAGSINLDRAARLRAVLAAQTGLRVSELIGLKVADIHLGAGANVSCLGKGRKLRITPLTSGMIAVLRVWLSERADPRSAIPAGHGDHDGLAGHVFERARRDRRRRDVVSIRPSR